MKNKSTNEPKKPAATQTRSPAVANIADHTNCQ